MQIVNQFSFVIFAALGGLLLALLVWRWKRASLLLRGGLIVLYVAGAAGLHLAYGYTQNFDGRLQTVEAALVNGRPTFLMLYSDY